VNIRDRIKRFERVPAGQVIPNPKNPRVHNQAQRAVLRDLLDQIGMADVLLVRETAAGQFILIDGHLRRELFRQHELVPVVILDLNDEEADLLTLTLDSSAGMAEWNQMLCEALIGSVSTSSEAIGGLLQRIMGEAASQAFEQRMVKQDEVPIDRAGELQKKWDTAAGQLWLAHPHRLLCGDSTDQTAVRRLLGNEQPEMLLTDPPYGVEYEPAWRAKIGGAIAAPRSTARILNDERIDWSTVYAESGCDVAYVWHAARYVGELAEGLRAAGYDLRSQIIWAKSHFALSRGDYHWQHEPCWYAVRKGRTRHWSGDHRQSTLWEIAGLNAFGGSRNEDDSPTGHSTQKPVECMARPIRNHRITRIFDPFCGSGTTLVAAQQLGRSGFGIELDPGYVAVALERLAKLGLEPILEKAE
jgi:hypothetical protein